MANPAQWIDSLTAATGINSVWLNKALRAGAITPDMSPDAVYKAVSEMATGTGRPMRQLQLPMGSDTAGDSVRSLIPYGVRGPGVPVGQPRGTGMSGDRVAAHNELRDSWPVAYDADEADVMDAMSEFSPEQRQYLQALRSNDWLGFDYPSQAASSGLASPNAASRLEMSPDLVAARQSLINSRLRGPGVAIPAQGGAMIPAPMRGLPAPQQARIGATAGVPVDRDFARQWDKARPLTFDASGRLVMSPRRGLPGPTQQALPAPSQARIAARDQQAVDGIASQFDRKLSGAAPSSAAPLAGGTPSPAAAMSPPQAGKRAWVKPALAAGAIGGGAIAWNMMPSGDLTNPAGTAELAAESRPVPSVPAAATDGQQLTEDEFTETFKQQYQAREDKRAARGVGGYADPSDKAKAILDDLNARRRKAGGEVPEARQMEAEANRLLAESNQMRNAPGYQPKNASNPREQAQVLLQQLNADRMEAGGEVPHSREVLQEVRRLQLLGDQQRWGG